MIQPQTARDLQLRLLPVQQAPKCCPACWLCRACGQFLVEIDQPSWHKLLGAAKLSVSKSHEASPGGTGWVGSSQVLPQTTRVLQSTGMVGAAVLGVTITALSHVPVCPQPY